MYYELYVDSLFLVNFVMNLNLLILVNRSMLRTATRSKLLLGAGIGALCYLLPFVIPASVWIKYPAALIVGTGLMIHITFHPKTLQGFWRILKSLTGYSFLIGGLLLFLNGALPWGDYFTTGVLTVCGAGALGTMVVGYCKEKESKRALRSKCRVTLIGKAGRVTVEALLDSGNSLVEPISGKPVSVIDEKLYRPLWGDREAPFRAIPYHSIGRKRGIMRGYLLPEMELEIDGVTKHFADVYMAIGEESGDVPVILNQTLLEGK